MAITPIPLAEIAREIVDVTFGLYAQVTIAATYKLNERYTFRLNVDNIADRKDYISVAGGRSWGSGLTTATGRNIRFTTTFNF